MRTYLINILKRLEIPSYAHQPVIDAYDKLKQVDIDFVLCKYEDENVEFRGVLGDWQFYVTRIYKLPDSLSSLLFCLLMCKKCEEIYKKKGLPEKLFIDTMKGISYTVEECRLVNNEIGTTVAWWFDDFFRLRRFAFGIIQIEIYHMGLGYKDEKISFTPYTKCLNIHIPRSKKRLEEKEIDKALEEAGKFFAPMFNYQPILYRCESWVLHHSALKLCTPESNLGKFQKRFNIFHQHDDQDISELWRIFDDKVDINHLDKLKTDTSLRRKYIEYVKNGGKFGEGVGFFIK